jgi:preflagellin peptidase FlaK
VAPCSKYLYLHAHFIKMSNALHLLRVIFALAFLFYGSYTDLKTRKVKNEVWIAMGICGGALIAIQLILEKKGWEYFLIFIPIGILFASMFFDFAATEEEEKKKVNFVPLILYIIGFMAVIYQLYALSGEALFYQLLTIPILIIFFFILYQLGMLHGGADAKAMMAIAIMIPFYPHFYEFPILQFSSERITLAMELFFPFAFLVLMNSVLFVVWVFLGFIVFNAAKKDFGLPEMLLGYKMDIDDIKDKFVWPMERVIDGERVLVLFPRKNDEESLETLKEMDIKRIWVTPKIPFIVFITGGFIISVFFGNVFAALMGLMG